MEKVLRWAMPAVQTVVSAVLLFLLISSRLLPGKYMGIAAAAVAVLLLITILFARSKSGAGRKDSFLTLHLRRADRKENKNEQRKVRDPRRTVHP